MGIQDVNGNLHSNEDGRFTEKAGTRPSGSLSGSRSGGRPRMSDEDALRRADFTAQQAAREFMKTEDGARIHATIQEITPLLELEAVFRDVDTDRDEVFKTALAMTLRLDEAAGGHLRQAYTDAVSQARLDRDETLARAGEQAPLQPTMKETTAMIRKDLKARWPGVKFSVRQSRGTAALWVNVDYQDGPLEKDVRAVLDTYEGRRFNGMTDSYDDQGTQLLAVPGAELPREVRFPTDGIICQRSFTATARTYAQTRLDANGYPEIRVAREDGEPNWRDNVPDEVLNRKGDYVMVDGVEVWGPRNEYQKNAGGLGDTFLHQVDLTGKVAA